MRFSVEKIAQEINVHPDTIWKAKRKGQASLRLSEKLEKATGIDRLKFLYPEKYGDGWAHIGNSQAA